MPFVVFVNENEFVCETKSDVAFFLIGLYSPIMEIPYQIEEIFERRCIIPVLVEGE